MKLHLACGPVYLKGYVNVDVVGELAVDRPDLVTENETTVGRYFKVPYIKRPLGHNIRRAVVVDMHANVIDMPFKNNSIEQILSVNLIDHLRIPDRERFLNECYRILEPGGVLITDVGDAVSNAQLLVDAKGKEQIEWALRLFYCHGRDEYDSHYWGYTGAYLMEIMHEHGFVFDWLRDDFIDHTYPSFQLSVRKESK